MNYYIQGDAAKADQIKAAFKKLGYDTSGHIFNANSVLYFTLDGEIRATTCNCTHAIIKTHPDYKELELSVKPKFKVGDWIAGIDDEGDIVTEKIVSFSHNKVLLVDTDGCHTEYPKSELNGYHLWTIQDAKDGDVLATTKCPFIYRKTVYNNNLAYYYAGVDGNGDFCEGCLKRTLYHFGPVADVVPATKEQRDLLFKKMKEADYEWDKKKKELRKIKPHYDITNFKPFDKVLVRDYEDGVWNVDLFGFYRAENKYHFRCNSNAWCMCIPFEGNEHLLGTTEMPSEEYINW